MKRFAAPLLLISILTPSLSHMYAAGMDYQTAEECPIDTIKKGDHIHPSSPLRRTKPNNDKS